PFVAGVLEVAGDVGPTVDLIHRVQAGGFGACGTRQQAFQRLRIHVVRPQEVVQVVTAVFANEQSTQLFREFQVVGAGDQVRIAGVAQAVGRARGQVFAGNKNGS